MSKLKHNESNDKSLWYPQVWRTQDGRDVELPFVFFIESILLVDFPWLLLRATVTIVFEAIAVVQQCQPTRAWTSQH